MTPVVVFDFDGVLADTLEDMLDFAKQVTAEMGFPCEPSYSDLDALNRMEFSEYGKQLGIPQDLIDKFVQGCFRLFTSKATPPKIFSGMREVVQSLAQTSRMVILTGNTSSVVNNFLSFHGLTSCFEAVLGADAPGTRAEKLEYIFTSMASPGERFYLVGDAVSDVRVAQQVGLSSVAVTWGHQSEARLRNAGPDSIARTPAELLEILL